jgi:ribosomal protein L29
MAMNAKDIAELSLVELEKQIRDVRHELLELRLKKKTAATIKRKEVAVSA